MHPSGEAWLQMLGLGILSAALLGLMFALVHRAGAGFASLYGYGLPVFGMLFGALAFGHALAWTLYLGALIAFVGVALLQWARRHEPARARPE